MHLGMAGTDPVAGEPAAPASPARWLGLQFY